VQETRQRIIEYLREKKQGTVDELAAMANLTPMTVRYHLNVLQSDNLVTAPVVRRLTGRGRPQQIYELTEAADDLFPVDYYSLTDYLLDELSLRLGQEGITEIFHSIADRLTGEIPPVKKNETSQERLDQVITFLQERGFVVDWVAQDDHYLIHSYSCPYRQVAKAYKQVCLLDQQVIGSMLNTTPTRVACITTDDDHCIYRVSEPFKLAVELN
jgi:predicted ArsR family transcriptional regulator